MVKVIKDGNVPKYRVKCHKCNALVEFSESDEIVIETDDFLWFEDVIDYHIVCPCCKTNIPTRSFAENDGKWYTFCTQVED